MSDTTSTLLAVMVGGSLAVGGSILADWLRSRHEQRQGERERLRENLYPLQDMINELFSAYQHSVESKNGHGAPWSQESNAQHNIAVRRVVMQCGRIGDGQIDYHLGQVMANLKQSHHTSDPQEADTILTKTFKTLMPPLALRIEQLLRTDARVDHKIGAWTSLDHPDMEDSAVGPSCSWSPATNSVPPVP